MSEREVSPLQRAWHLRLMGRWMGSNSQSEEALQLFRKALALLEPMDADLQKAHTNFELGRHLEMLNRQSEASQAFLDAYTYYSKASSDSGLAEVNERMAILWWRQGELDKALERALESRKFKLGVGDSLGLARSSMILGNLLAQQGDDRAEVYFTESLRIWEKMGHLENLAIAQNNLANFYSSNGKLAEAEALYLESIELRKLRKDDLGLAESYNNVGDFYYLQDKYDRAARFFELSIEKSAAANAISTQAIAQENLSYALYELGRYRQAADHSYQADSLKDHIRKDTYGKQVAKLQEKFEASERERTINGLKNENDRKAFELTEQRWQRNQWIIGAGFLFLLLAFATISIVQHRKKNLQLKTVTASKEQLFAIIAHNLQGPLTSLDGISGVINHYIEKEEWAKLNRIVREIDKTAQQLNALVHNLLSWARTENGTIPHQPAKLQLHGALSQVLEIVAIQANMKDLTVELDVESSISVRADLSFLKTVSTNLLHNAIKFTPKNGRIDIRAKVEGEKVIVSICDNGIGIAADRLDSIFEPMAEKSTQGTQGESGTGLGLHVSRQLIELEGGSLTVESTPGNGSCFLFTLTHIP